MSDVVAIDRIGTEGDGVATATDGTVFVPFTLPGETVRIARDGARAHVTGIVTPSPDRRAPACRHFGTCGGCALQHWEASKYRAWKAGLVGTALAARGLDVRLEPLRPAAHGERRRAVLTARGGTTGPLLGFHAEGTHTLVDIAECPVLAPTIVAALPGLRALVAPLVSRRGSLRLTVNLLDNGLDVAIEGSERGLDSPLRASLAKAATTLRLVRLSLDGDPLAVAATPVLDVAGVAVTPPPGAFLQASRTAEQAMAGLIVEALPKKVKRVADLFCGLGTFTFAIARRAQVLPIDAEAPLIEALSAASRNASGLKPIETRLRDLMREPLSPLELGELDAVVLDPPRAGAEAQAQRLARSKVATVIAVSCNPASLARDLRLLVDGGFAIERVTPIDQFLYSPHVEAVAVLRRAK
jgi:23S rRNA (uracil1939-C5)-methyltransferase